MDLNSHYKDYPTLHLDTDSSKETAFLLLIYICWQVFNINACKSVFLLPWGIGTQCKVSCNFT